MLTQPTLEIGKGEELPKTLSKRGFAQHLGLSEARISQLIDMGLPVEANGRIDRVKAKAWYDDNIDANRKRAAPAPAVDDSARVKRLNAEAKTAELKAERLAGNLIDRQAFIDSVETRARAERDAWIGWVNRAAPELARQTGADMAKLVAILDRLVREQLNTLSSQSIEDLKR